MLRGSKVCALILFCNLTLIAVLALCDVIHYSAHSGVAVLFSPYLPLASSSHLLHLQQPNRPQSACVSSLCPTCVQFLRTAPVARRAFHATAAVGKPAPRNLRPDRLAIRGFRATVAAWTRTLDSGTATRAAFEEFDREYRCSPRGCRHHWRWSGRLRGRHQGWPARHEGSSHPWVSAVSAVCEPPCATDGVVAL